MNEWEESKRLIKNLSGKVVIIEFGQQGRSMFYASRKNDGIFLKSPKSKNSTK